LQVNADVWDWSLPQSDYLALCSLGYQQRMVDGSFLLNAAGPYCTLEDLWDEPSPQ
jgi:hypothetical protein